MSSAVGYQTAGARPLLVASMAAMAEAAPRMTGVEVARLLSSSVDSLPDDASLAPAQGTRREANQCWGQMLSGAKDCGVPDSSDRRHLQSRFCLNCRTDGIRIPADRIRVQPPELNGNISNNAAGLWMRHKSGTMPYCRVINQTFQCNGPRLVVFRTPISPNPPMCGTSPALEKNNGQLTNSLPHNPWLPAAWPRVADEMVGADGRVHFVVAKGTLVPPVASPATAAPQPQLSAIKATALAPAPPTLQGAPEAVAPAMEMRVMPPHKAPLFPARLSGLRGGASDEPYKSCAHPPGAQPPHPEPDPARLSAPPLPAVPSSNDAADSTVKKRARDGEAVRRQAGENQIRSPPRCAAPAVGECTTAIGPRAAHGAYPSEPSEPVGSQRDATAAGILKALEDLEARLYSFVLHEDAAEEPQPVYRTTLPIASNTPVAKHSTLVQPAQGETPLTGAPSQSIERLRLAMDDTSAALRAACLLAAVAAYTPPAV